MARLILRYVAISYTGNFYRVRSRHNAIGIRRPRLIMVPVPHWVAGRAAAWLRRQYVDTDVSGWH